MSYSMVFITNNPLEYGRCMLFEILLYTVKALLDYDHSPALSYNQHCSIEQAKIFTRDESGFAALVDGVFASATSWQQVYCLGGF